MSDRERASATKTILLGGLAVGLGDFTDAMLYFAWYRGLGPIRLWQSVARGLLGSDAFQGGVATAALGLLLHFVIATGVAAVYYGASRSLPVLVRRPWACGLAYGVVVFYVMNLVVLPLSRVGHVSLAPSLGLVNGIVGHALLVGLPAALVVRWGRTGA